MTPPTGPAVAFTYDPLGNMLTASRGGAVMSLTYDKAGRKLTMNDPDMGFWQYSYNALGGMTRQEDAKNQVACLYYDELNRPRGKDYFTNSAACPSDPGSGYEVTYNYDSTANGNLGKGRRTSMTDGSGSTTWYYDQRGRVWKETKVISGISFDTEWTYNSADLPKTMKYPDGEIVTTGYNNNMLPTDVSGAGNYVPSMTYDSAGRLLTRALGNGLTQIYGYYPWNQQGGRLHTLVAGNLQNLSYAYDSVGNITSIADSINSQTQSFDYDALDRLTSASANGEPGQGAYDETYQYDPATGNLKVKGDMTLDYLDSNHVHAVTNANGNTYSYDDNGNQTTRHIGNDTFHLIYDAENRLVEVKKNVTTIAEFTFDGDGKRVMSVIGGETIRFVGGYYERKGSQITKYYMAGAARVAIRKYTIPQSMTVEYLLGDHLGSTSITTDSNGAMISEMRYKPWGETRYTWTNAPATTPTYELTRYQYTGQYSYDVEFGLKYYNARWLDSTTGRFTQPDTLVPDINNPQSWDRFAYVGNNPCNNTDPDGHCWPLCTMAIGALIGAAASVAVYVGVSAMTGEKMTWGRVAGAALAGGITGAMAGVAGPIAGTVMGMAGVSVTTTSLAVGTAVVNAAVGAAAYVESTALQNAIDVPNGEQPVPITVGGALTAGALSGVAGAIVDPLPMKGMFSIRQAQYFAPGRTINSLFSTSAVQNLYTPGLYSGLLENGLTNIVQPAVLNTVDSQCVYDDHGFSSDPSCVWE